MAVSLKLRRFFTTLTSSLHVNIIIACCVTSLDCISGIDVEKKM